MITRRAPQTAAHSSNCSCTACAAHRRPQDVPWHQHAIGPRHDLAGGSAIYDGAPLQRRFRDAFTATAHFQVNEASRELPGRILLGQTTEAAML